MADEDAELLRLRARAKLKLQQKRATAGAAAGAAGRTTPPPAPAPAARPAPPEPEPSEHPLAAIFPQAVRGYEAGAFDKPGGFTAGALTAAGDVVDAPRRTYMALKAMLTGRGMEEAGAQAQRPPEGIVERIASEAPLMATPAGAGRTLIAQGAGALRKAGAFVPGAAERLVSTITGRGVEAAPTVALHQAERVAAGQEPSLGAAAGETGLAMAIPFVGGEAGKFLKGTGRRIIQTAIKTSGLKSAAYKTLTADQADRILTDYGSLRGLPGIADKMEKAHDVLSRQFDRLINMTTAGKKVNLRGALAQADNELDALEKSAAINLDDAVAMRAALNRWKAGSQAITDKAGWTSFQTAQEFKKNTLDQLARYSKIPREMQLPGVPGTAAAARLSRRELSGQMGRIEPGLQPLNRQFQQLAELEPHIIEALERTARNRGLSLQDLATLSAGMLGAGGAGFAGRPELALAAMLPFLASRAQKSPGFATAAHGAGSLLDRLAAARGVTTPLRSAMEEGGGEGAMMPAPALEEELAPELAPEPAPEPAPPPEERRPVRDRVGGGGADTLMQQIAQILPEINVMQDEELAPDIYRLLSNQYRARRRGLQPRELIDVYAQAEL